MAKPNLYRSRILKPYHGKNSNLSFAKSKSGVYLIYDKDGTVVYVGYSETQLEKTVLRHFQQWHDKTQVRTAYKDRDNMTVRLVITTPARAAKLEKALIIKLRPKDNPDKLQHYTMANLTQQTEELLTEFINAPASDINTMEQCPF